MPSRFQPTFGCDLDDLRVDVKSAIQRAAGLKFKAVEVGASSGEVSPEQLSLSGRRHFVRYLAHHGLRLASLSADWPQLRFTDPAAADRRVELTLRVIDMARDMGAPVVCASAGPMSHPDNGEPSSVALEALSRIADAADHRGVRLAIRPTHETGERLAALLHRIDCPAMRICLDPAAIVMTGGNPLAGMDQLADRVALLHVRDATAGVIDRSTGEGRAGHETRLGDGDVDYVGLLSTLRDADYHEPFIIRRTASRAPDEDISRDADAFRMLLAR